METDVNVKNVYKSDLGAKLNRSHPHIGFFVPSMDYDGPSEHTHLSLGSLGFAHEPRKNWLKDDVFFEVNVEAYICVKMNISNVQNICRAS